MIRECMKNEKYKFIIRYGVLRFGLPSGLTMCLLYELLNLNFELKKFDINKIFSVYSLIFVILFLLGGYLWGYVMWRLFQKRKPKELS